jgi:hypothetical protein
LQSSDILDVLGCVGVGGAPNALKPEHYISRLGEGELVLNLVPKNFPFSSMAL